MGSVYLDYNASAPVDPRVLDVMIDVYKNKYGNADSRTHDFGETARKVVADGRKQVADLIGVKSEEVFFTSGATESNNMALLGLTDYAERTGKKHIITSMIEHKAILNAAKHLETKGYEVEYVRPAMNGRINAEDVLKRVREDTLLVSIMHANNETGVIQPVDIIGEELSKRGVLFHSDITQTCGKLVEEIRSLKYDMLSIAAHKIYGPQGIGAIILKRKRYKLPPVQPILFGGGQEHGLRPGTTPVPLVAGFGKACELASLEYKKDMKEYADIKAMLLELLEQSGVQYEINGDQNNCLPNTINVSFTGVVSEALMLATKQYCGISNGSACNSRSYEPSYVLAAMRVPGTQIESIRVSWGRGVSKVNVAQNFKELLKTAKSLAI